MTFLGLVLAAAAIAFGFGVATDTGPAKLVVFGHTVPNVTAQWQIFLAGAIAGAVLVCGLMAVISGLRRSLRRRREFRDLREAHQESVATLEMQKQQLQRELTRARRQPGPAAPPARPAPRDSLSVLLGPEH